MAEVTTPPETVTITVDGREMPAKPGELLIKAAEDNGVYIPRFCWHERLRSVAMCRMCLVEVDGMRGMQPACYVPVADGMNVRTQTPAVQKAQEGVLEFLLVNHPLDCPVCDRGGECPLQDHTLAFGPGESRFVENKRHYEKPIPISDLVLLDRERCIQCSRCTRFAQEVAGDPLIDFGMRGNNLHIITFPEDPFASHFSGNVVQICPVGALTAAPYRFKARPWDVTVAETTCQQCAVGCRGALYETRNEPIRLLGVDADAVNWGWLCDKGRFGYEYVSSSQRLTVPTARQAKGAMPADVTWAEAIDLVAAKVGQAHGRIAALGGARLTNEEAYALAKFVRVVGGTNDIDAQLGDGLPGSFVVGVPNRATIADLDSAAAIVVAAPDLKDELPVLYLRVRDAVVNKGVALHVVGGRQSGLDLHAAQLASGFDSFDAAKLPADGPVVVIVGRQALTQDPSAPAQWALDLVAAHGDRIRLLPTLRRANVHGALDMGASPELLPGRVTVDDPAARARLAAYWAAEFPLEPGRDARGILQAAADGEIDVLFIVGADPIGDLGDPDLARRALERCPFVVVADLFATEVAEYADVVVPAAGWGEVDGTVTNLEGRVSRVAARVIAPGQAASDANLLREVAERVGVDFGCGTWQATLAEIGQVAPVYAGIKPSTLRGKAGVEGIALPSGPAVPHVPAATAGSGRPDAALRLDVVRGLYDQGTLVAECPSLAGLGVDATVALHPDEVARAGLRDGTKVVVKSASAEPAFRIEATVVADDGVREGVAVVAHARSEEPQPFAVGMGVKLEKA